MDSSDRPTGWTRADSSDDRYQTQRRSIKLRPSNYILNTNTERTVSVASKLALGDVIPHAELRAGTQVLVAAESAADLRGVPELVLEMGVETGDGAIVVSTEDPDQIIADRVSGLEGLAPETVGVIDCTPGVSDAHRSGSLFHALAAKNDLTGVSMALSDCTRALRHQGVDRIHLLYDSLTPVLFAEDPDVAVRFVHHLMGRTSAADGIGVYPVYTNMTSDRGLARMKHLADAFVEVRRQGEERQVRCRGFRAAPTGWTPLEPAGADAARSRSD